MAKAASFLGLNNNLNTLNLYNAGYFDSIEAMKNWYIADKPSRVWLAYIALGGILILGAPFHDYMNGYGSYILFGYFTDHIKLTCLQDGKWIEY